MYEWCEDWYGDIHSITVCGEGQGQDRAELYVGGNFDQSKLTALVSLTEG